MASQEIQDNNQEMSPELRFPLLRLPIELQTSIMCKCDLPTIRTLLNTSSYFKNLLLAYPEANLQEILRQFPRPVSSLLHVCWALEGIHEHFFDTDLGLAILEQVSITEWTVLMPRLLGQNSEMINTLEGLAGLYEDVNEAVDVFSDSVSRCVYAFMKPWAQVPAPILSPAERMRMTSALLTMMIFQRLRLNYAYHERYNEFVAPFIAGLSHHEREQCIAVDCFIRDIVRSHGPFKLLFFGENNRSSPQRILSRSLFMCTYADLAADSHLYCHNSPCQCHAAVLRRHMNNYPTPPTDLISQHPERNSLDNDLHNSAWDYLTAVMRTRSLTSRDYGSIFVQLGVFFWDDTRLSALGFNDPDDFPILLEISNSRQESIRRYMDNLDEYALPLSDYKRNKLSGCIYDWTRCPVQCTLEEWVYMEYDKEWNKFAKMLAE